MPLPPTATSGGVSSGAHTAQRGMAALPNLRAHRVSRIASTFPKAV